METKKLKKEYEAPVVKVVEVIVEQGFAISAVIQNDRFRNGTGAEHHFEDDYEIW